MEIHPTMKFIWSEVSFLEKWWQDANQQNRSLLLRLIQNGQLEISGGSWVMTDEATPYFWASIDNLIVGHQFLLKNLNVTPTTSWSVDPFGHGMMVPYLLSLSGINKMVIGRINTEIKNQLKAAHRLHFRWAQSWDTKLKNAPVVNVLPNHYYTTISACGPSSSICCQFDVSQTARTFCSERASVKSPESVKKFATRMADQYRQLQDYYRSSSVLVAAGDDFAYSSPDDLPIVYTVYSTLFDYINTHPEFNMTVKFGTLADYFDSISDSSKTMMPIMLGDFFPYVDDMHNSAPYWTGFYNHRAYHKRFERVLQAKLRALDILSVTNNLRLSDELEIARRNLALFQHHDAITGTSTRSVMQDYLHRLQDAFNRVVNEQTKLISEIYNDQHTISLHTKLPMSWKGPLLINSIIFNETVNEFHLVIFNQKSFEAHELVTVVTNTANVLLTQDGQPIIAQISKIPESSPSLIELSFMLKLEPLSHAIVAITKQDTQIKSTVWAVVNEANNGMIGDANDTIVFETDRLILTWGLRPNANHSITLKNSNRKVDFMLTFSTVDDRGGAYTFITNVNKPSSEYFFGKLFFDGKTEGLKTSVVSGPVVSSVFQRLGPHLTLKLYVLHSPSCSTSQALHLELWSNTNVFSSSTLLLNLHTSLQSVEHFYTDINGMHLTQRSYDRSVPLGANIYPVASEAMIEDADVRFTILTAQPTGLTALDNLMTMMVDRESIQDDGKGLPMYEASGGIAPYLKYRLLFEEKLPEQSIIENNNEDIFYHSFLVQQNLEQLLYPFELYIQPLASQQVKQIVQNKFADLPCQIQLINARFIDHNKIILSFRILPYDCNTIDAEACTCNGDPLDLRGELINFIASFGGQAYESNLTGTKIGRAVSLDRVDDYLSIPLRITTLVIQMDQSHD